MADNDRLLDTIFIRDLHLRCIIGVNDDERRAKQDIVINVAMNADLRAAGKSDKLEETVDYKAIKKRILGLVEDSAFFLVESLAENIARLCLENERVIRTRVTVDKPGALRFARSVAVEIVRERGTDA